MKMECSYDHNVMLTDKIKNKKRIVTLTCHWIVKDWNGISTESIKKSSSKLCCVSNNINLDGLEDDFVLEMM